MSSIQYTIRSIPTSVDQILRREAKLRGTSLNETIVQALERATGVGSKPNTYNDLDHLFGKGIEDAEAFDAAMKDMADSPVEKDFKLS